VVTVFETENCMDVYHLMGGLRIRHIAVTDADGLLVGVVSESDILRNFGVEYYMRFKDVAGAMAVDVGLLPESATVAEVVALMDERRYSCVFAVDAARRPLGVLTERDIVRLCHEHDSPEGLTMGATMSKPVRSVKQEDLLHDAVKLMADAHIRRLAVVDADGSVCGVLTHHEVVNGLEGHYVAYLKDMIYSQEKALQSKQAVVNEKRLLGEHHALRQRHRGDQYRPDVPRKLLQPGSCRHAQAAGPGDSRPGPGRGADAARLGGLPRGADAGDPA